MIIKFRKQQQICSLCTALGETIIKCNHLQKIHSSCSRQDDVVMKSCKEIWSLSARDKSGVNCGRQQ